MKKSGILFSTFSLVLMTFSTFSQSNARISTIKVGEELQPEQEALLHLNFSYQDQSMGRISSNVLNFGLCNTQSYYFVGPNFNMSEINTIDLSLCKNTFHYSKAEYGFQEPIRTYTVTAPNSKIQSVNVVDHFDPEMGFLTKYEYNTVGEIVTIALFSDQGTDTLQAHFYEHNAQNVEISHHLQYYDDNGVRTGRVKDSMVYENGKLTEFYQYDYFGGDHLTKTEIIYDGGFIDQEKISLKENGTFNEYKRELYTNNGLRYLSIVEHAVENDILIMDTLSWDEFLGSGTRIDRWNLYDSPNHIETQIDLAYYTDNFLMSRIETNMNNSRRDSFEYTYEGSLGLEKNPNVSAVVSLYPNPSTKNVTITCSAKIIQLSLLDFNGKTLLVETHMNTIDVSSFEAGFYIVKIETAQGTVSKKLTVI
jgi:hypothetical protein